MFLNSKPDALNSKTGDENVLKKINSRLKRKSVENALSDQKRMSQRIIDILREDDGKQKNKPNGKYTDMINRASKETRNQDEAASENPYSLNKPSDSIKEYLK
jgi:hypothetical protein